MPRKYYLEHKAERLAYQRKHRLNHPEIYKKYVTRYCKSQKGMDRRKIYYETNKELILNYGRIYYLKNRNKLIAQSKANFFANHEKRLEHNRAYSKLYRKNPPRLYKSYRVGAEKRSLSFELTFEQFMTFWQKPCHYCDDPIETIGLDRKDSSAGYFLQNIVPCCKPCNWMKGVVHYDHFIKRIHRISMNLL